MTPNQPLNRSAQRRRCARCCGALVASLLSARLTASRPFRPLAIAMRALVGIGLAICATWIGIRGYCNTRHMALGQRVIEWRFRWTHRRLSSPRYAGGGHCRLRLRRGTLAVVIGVGWLFAALSAMMGLAVSEKLRVSRLGYTITAVALLIFAMCFVYVATKSVLLTYFPPYASLRAAEKATVDGEVAVAFKTNRYDPASDTLTLPPGSQGSLRCARSRTGRTTSRIRPRTAGSRKGRYPTPSDLRQLTAFFVWTAWASAVQRPGTTHSYTNNFPYDPLVGNHPHRRRRCSGARSACCSCWAASRIVLLAFGKFDYLGWHGDHD